MILACMSSGILRVTWQNYMWQHGLARKSSQHNPDEQQLITSCQLFPYNFKQTLILTQIRTPQPVIYNFMKICLTRDVLFHANGQTDTMTIHCFLQLYEYVSQGMSMNFTDPLPTFTCLQSSAYNTCIKIYSKSKP